MSLKCRVFRDEKGQIDFVNAENGNRSKLFDKLVDITGGNKNTALNIYALTEVDELKEAMGAKLNALKERFKKIVKVAPETSPMAGEVMFSKTATKPTYFSNAIGAINNLADKNPKNTQGWLKQLTDTQKNGGIKNVNQELEWIGLEDYLTSYVKENSPKAGNIPASVVEDYIKANQIEIVDIGKGMSEEPFIKTDEDGFFILEDSQGNRIRPYDKWLNFDDVKEVAKSYVGQDSVKYEGYQLKGGKNYREVLLTMPSKDGVNPLHAKRDQLSKQYREAFDSGNYDLSNKIDREISEITKQLKAENSLNATGEKAKYKSSHWDEANILAHVRLNEKTLPDGRKVLIVNEIQSDWAQEGRKKGFKMAVPKGLVKVTSEDLEVRKTGLDEYALYYKGTNIIIDGSYKLERVAKEVLNSWKTNNTSYDINLEEEQKGIDESVSQMPYKNTDQWLGLATRRVLQMAAQEGYDGVSFATGQQSADMYSLSNQVDKINIEVFGEKRGAEIFLKNGGQPMLYINQDGIITGGSEVYVGKKSEEVLGKELTKRILETKENTTLAGEGLEIGGEGMKTFYDSIVPKVAQKEAQRFDKNAKLGSVDFTKTYGITTKTYKGADGNTKWMAIVESRGGTRAVGNTEQEAIDKYIERYPDIVNSNKLEIGQQPFIAITDKMRSELGKAIPMFSKNQGQEAPREVLDQVTDRLKQSGLANNVYQMTNAQIEAKLIELGVSPEIAKQVTISETDVDTVNFNTEEDFWDVYLKDGSYIEVYLPENATEEDVKKEAALLVREYLLDAIPTVYRGINGQFSPDFKGVQYFAVNKRYAGVFGRNIEEFRFKSPDILDLDNWNKKWGVENVDFGQGLLTVHQDNLSDLKEWKTRIKNSLIGLGIEVPKEELDSFIKEVENAKIIKGEDIGNTGQIVFAVKDKNLVEPINKDIQFSKGFYPKTTKKDTRLKVIKDALKIEAYTPEVEVANYFLSGGRVSEESIKKLYRNSKGEVKARASLISKTAPSINQIAQSLWENSEIRDNDGESAYTDQDYVNFIEELLSNNNTRKSIAEEVLRPYQIENNIPEEDYLYLLSDEYIENQILEREAFEKLNFSKLELTTAGFTYKGDVYLNTDAMGLDTPIHEFGHLHLDWLKENRTDLYQAGLSLIGKNKEEAQQYIDIVKETQPDLKEGTEKFNNEVLAQVIGDQGAKLVNSKKEDSIADWLRNVWEAIKDILGLSNYTAEQVANMTLAEFGTASAAEMLSGRVIKDGLDFSTFSPNKVISGVNQDLVNLSEQYKKENNLPLELPRLVISLSEKDAMRVADAYDEMKHDPNNPEVELAYKSLITEIKKQADLLLNAGYKFELSTKERGYNSSSEMIKDVKDNKHIFIDPSSENFGTTREFNEDNIGLADSGYKDINGNPLTNVEVIRAVHDVFGHAKFGTQFGAIGEENAWRVHMSMFSPEAQKALTATTRGQNSWVNFGGHMRKDGKVLKKGDEGYMSPTERPFAEQKIGILPDWATDNSYGDTITINGESITPVNKYSILGEDIYEISDGKAYYDAILSAKNSRLGKDIPEDVRDGIQVYVKSAKEYQDIIDKGGKLLVSKDGLTGVMVEADGNIGSGFNHSSNNKPNSLAPYLIAGIKMGARYTDAYDTYLPKYYAKFGFVASERMKFDETYAEEGWDKSILKTKPDVVFMYFDGGDRMTIEDRVGTFEPYKKTDGDYIEDYDQGVENTKNKTSEKSSLIPLVSKPEAYDVNYSMVTPTSKNISPENSSNYANLTEDGEGNFVFYHVGRSGYDVIKRTSGDTINTSREEAQALAKVGGLAMYYSKPEDGETMIKGESKYMVKIPINKVYDFNTDSLNLTEKAKELHSKEHPGKSFDANTQVAYVTKIAADFGYEMVVAEWQNRTRAQSIKEHKPNDTQISEGATIKKPFQENYESNSSKGFKSVIPVPKKEQLKQLYLDLNNYRNRENRYDDIYSLYEEYSKLSQEEIRKRIENSDIPQEYKSKYESIVSSEEGKRMSIPPVQKSVIRQPSLELNGTKIFAKDRMNPITGEKLDGIEWELIESTERGQGNARKAAELFLNGTDAQEKDVYLTISPRDTTTKPERLESFYSSLGFEKTSDFEMVRKARPVSLKDTDSNGEPSIKTLMDFSNSKVKPLGLEGLKAAKNSAMALKVKSSKELVEKMEKALMKNGIVLFDKLSLQRSKLYNNFEINTILSSPKLQKQIKESLLSLRNSEPFEIEYDENFIVPQGREVNQFGKQDVINPNLVENELMQSVAGLEESEIDEALPDSLVNRYYTDSNFKETVDAIAKDYKKAPIKTVVDGELIDKTEDVEGMLLNTLTEGLDDSITRDVAFLRGEIDEEIFSSNLTRVSKVLNMIKKNAYINGIDLRNLPTLALELSRSEILGFLDSMEDVIKDPSNPENFIEFTERYYKILGDKELKTEVIKSNSQNDVIVEEPLSEYEMFSEFGLVKKDDGIYRKVQEQSLDSLYESFFEYKNLLPEGIESIEALKVYVQKNASLLEVSDYEVDVDNLEKIFLYKKFFDFPMSTQSPRVNTENFNKITNPEDYLTDDFVKDFNKWLLTTANPYFKVTSKGVELVNKDELSKTEAVNSVPERFKQELAEYNIISDNLNLDMPLLEEKYEDINTQLEQRQKAVNNPDRVKKVSGQYTYLKDGVLAAKNESETFVKTPIGIFEKIFEFENVKFYGKLDTSKNQGYKKISIEAPFSDINFKDYMYLASSPEAFKTSKNYYSKKELDDINEEYFGCQ